ncbi:MAG: hypothetical protein EOS23_13300 [Mesorhizobium sp.]|uniref:hypothetical protein n=1 Tax=Mesorhizobium TaxID=68287 RepID=UPI000FD31AAC|nr:MULTISPECIES: hypothetical protein [Mesorhizobium]MCF6115123.1 hypothetical protein [Mesorhizobium muleiense]RVD17319.1 hypothetical protein EN749_09170 [Mesorhizobium sp. M7A.F.Ca.ET.027.02.1.1]RWC98865.1 MAG: hypothetical protein EOS73_29950 [Mesorhizobium sp.]RWD45721.1 MAG: hypothetical protein EOS59_21200 [Mesorhizobium sp.]RWD45731.1 MAG: hypothetical protein EOS59_21285 [Mesorhizobium sp.]
MGIEDLWNMTDEQLEAVKQKLIEQKPLVRTYWSQAGEAIDLFMIKEIVASNSWSYITATLKSQGLPVREFAGSPPIGWIDSHFIVKGDTEPGSRPQVYQSHHLPGIAGRDPQCYWLHADQPGVEGSHEGGDLGSVALGAGWRDDGPDAILGEHPAPEPLSGGTE